MVSQKERAAAVGAHGIEHRVSQEKATIGHGNASLRQGLHPSVDPRPAIENSHCRTMPPGAPGVRPELCQKWPRTWGYKPSHKPDSVRPLWSP